MPDVMTPASVERMIRCAPLLPAPGGEVVVELSNVLLKAWERADVMQAERDEACSEIVKLKLLIEDERRDATRVARELRLMASKQFLSIDRLRCPLCGGDVIWTCGSDEGPTGHADCGDGRRATSPLYSGRPTCCWEGTPLVRIGNDVYAVLPIQTESYRFGPRGADHA
jgi:hypothetical protein